MNEISNELSSINNEILELERSRANINVEYIKKYSFENIVVTFPVSTIHPSAMVL